MPRWPGHRRRQVRYRARAQHGGPDSPGMSPERVQVGCQLETSRHLNERVIPLCRVEIQASLGTCLAPLERSSSGDFGYETGGALGAGGG